MPRNQQSQGRPKLTINPDDAAARGIVREGIVAVRCNGQRIETVAHVSAETPAGVVVLEGKWWDNDEAGSVPLNRLTASGWSPAGQPAYNDTFVTIEQA